MKDIVPFDFTPDYQPSKKHKVSFKLRPLSQRDQYEMQTSMVVVRGNLKPSWDGVCVAAQQIVGWAGVTKRDGSALEFSSAAVDDVIESENADPRWSIWLYQIAGALYRRAVLSEDTAKKS